MSETDSFIEEVSEEVRRDRLFQLFRRYGWIAILLVVVIVGGAAWNEWNKSQERASAEATGNALLSALETEDPEARAAALDTYIATLEPQSEAAALANFLTSAAKVDAEDEEGARSALAQIKGNETLPQTYRDLASYKLLLLEGNAAPASERRAAFEVLATPGNPLRLLAEEQLALIDLEEADESGAILRLQAIVSDQEVTSGLRNRAAQLIVALGGSLDAG